MTAWIVLFGTAGLVPLGASAGLLQVLPTLSLKAWLSVLWLAVPCTLIGYGGWYYALARVDASRAAPFQYLQPLHTALVTALLLGEWPDVTTLLGAIFIVLGLFVAGSDKR